MDLTVNQVAYAFGGASPSLPTAGTKIIFIALCVRFGGEVAKSSAKFLSLTKDRTKRFCLRMQ